MIRRASFHDAIGIAEAAIYVVIGVLLVAAAVFTIVGTVRDLIEGSGSRPITDTGVFLLDRILLLFIFAELLYTLALVSARGGRILVEPFLFIGLIAVVRRILIVTAEADLTGRAQTVDFVIQIGASAALALILALSIHLLRRSAAQQP